jgi:hypothetical protein
VLAGVGVVLCFSGGDVVSLSFCHDWPLATFLIILSHFPYLNYLIMDGFMSKKVTTDTMTGTKRPLLDSLILFSFYTEVHSIVVAPQRVAAGLVGRYSALD